MRASRNTILFAFCILGVLLFSGCTIYVPVSDSRVTDMYPRVNQRGVTNELIIVVRADYVWPTLTPDGPSYRERAKSKMFYYYSDRSVRRRYLSFLGTDATFKHELFMAVEGTNCWVRIEAPWDQYSPNTNTLVITAFTPHQMLYQQNIVMTDFPSTNYLHFLDGNRVVTYKSKNDGFSYNVLNNSLDIGSKK
jgi:hypothetical protein